MEEGDELKTMRDDEEDCVHIFTKLKLETIRRNGANGEDYWGWSEVRRYKRRNSERKLVGEDEVSDGLKKRDCRMMICQQRPDGDR